MFITAWRGFSLPQLRLHSLILQKLIFDILFFECYYYFVINSFLEGILSLIYPSNCLICKEHIITHSPTDVLCLQCLSKIKNNIPPFCVKCSRHLSTVSKSNKCNSCKEMSPYFDFAWSSCLYIDPLKNLLQRFKYHQKTLLRQTFCQLMITFIEKYQLDIHQFDIIVPIPLFSSKLRERGFNQSVLLANEIGKHFNIPVNNDIIVRTANTKSQTILNKKERWTNIKGAFRIKPSINISNKSILIIDDLITTGATSSEAARVLKENRANTIGILTLATAI